MWIVKGALLGTGLFLVGTAFFLVAVASPLRANKATGLSVIAGLTIHNPLFWAAFVASLVIGCAIVGSWPVAAKM
jgi:hypothetical protein